jgi:hypothetical protein
MVDRHPGAKLILSHCKSFQKWYCQINAEHAAQSLHGNKATKAMSESIERAHIFISGPCPSKLEHVSKYVFHRNGERAERLCVNLKGRGDGASANPSLQRKE